MVTATVKRANAPQPVFGLMRITMATATATTPAMSGQARTRGELARYARGSDGGIDLDAQVRRSFDTCAHHGGLR